MCDRNLRKLNIEVETFLVAEQFHEHLQLVQLKKD